MSVGARALKWQQLRAYAGKWGSPVTVQIKADAGTGLTTVDGYAARTGVNESWAAIHGGAGNSARPADVYGKVNVTSIYFGTGWAEICRWITTHSLGGIPAGSLINSARYAVYGYRKWDSFGYKPKIALFQSYPAADNNVVAADYQHLYNTELSNVIGYDDFVTGGFNYFVLNDAGLALLVPGQIARLGLREAKFDAPFIQPTWVRNKGMGFQWYQVDAPNPAVHPYLEVVYQPWET